MASFEFLYDYGSPFSYLANSRISGLAERTGAEAVYRPILLGGIFKATGNQSPAMDPVEARRRYGAIELLRWASDLELPIRMNPHFPVNTLQLMRGAIAAQRLNVFAPYHAACFAAMWEEERNMQEPEVVQSVLEKAGLDAAEIFALSQEPETKEQLKANTEQAVARGVFGVPTLFVGDEMVFGNDRIDFAERLLQGGATGRSPVREER